MTQHPPLITILAPTGTHYTPSVPLCLLVAKSTPL